MHKRSWQAQKQKSSMKILIFGAGIIGQIYSSRLFASGVDVTLLARGENYETIKKNGIEIKNILTKETTILKVSIIKEINPNKNYDLIIVTVRLDQLKTIYSTLNNDNSAKAIMFMLNNIHNIDELQQQYPNKDIVLGFPGVGGTRKNNIIEYIQIKQQKTTLGNLNGESKTLVSKIKGILTKAGFQTTIEANMKWWLKTHALFITCASAAIMKQDGNSKKLGRNKKAVREMIDSVAEGFKGLQKLGIQITPNNLKTIFLIMPKWFSVWYWRKALRGNMGTLAIAPHVKAAKPEMQLLAKNVLSLVHSSSFKTPTLNNLLTEFIENDESVASH
jgi:2-dehydropantoate 2-reductase